MITPDDRRRLAEHAAYIRNVEDKCKALEVKLREPHEALLKQVERSDEPFVSDDRAARMQYLEDHQKAIVILQRIMDEVHAFRQPHTVGHEPWETPADVLNSMGYDDRLIEYKRTTLKHLEMASRITRQERVDEEEEVRRETFFKLRARVLAFHRIVHSVRDDWRVKEVGDAWAGLQNLRLWCEDAAATPTVDHAREVTEPDWTAIVAKDGDARMGYSDIEVRFDLPTGSLRKKLGKWVTDHPDEIGSGFVENADRKSTEPKHLFRLAAVIDVVKSTWREYFSDSTQAAQKKLQRNSPGKQPVSSKSSASTRTN